MVTQNPNWPRITDTIDFVDSRSTPVAGCLCWVDVTWRSRNTTAVDAGRQYETDQQRAGQLRAVLDNSDSALDPTNTSSPFYPLVLPRRLMRRTAQYPVTANLLLPDQATAGSYSAVASGTVFQATADTTSGGAGSSVSDLSGFLAAASETGTGVTVETVTDGPNAQCPNVFQVAMTAGQSGDAINLWVPVAPGEQYTLQWRVRCTTAGQSPVVAARLRFAGSGGVGDITSTVTGGTVALTGGTGAWSTVTVTGTAPASVFGMAVTLAVTTGAAGACTLQATACQLEYGATVSAWGLPGQVYAFITGSIEGWPQSYDETGQWGTVEVVASDLLAFLNQGQLLDAVGSTVMQYTPSFYYRLDDPQGSSEVIDAAGMRQAAPVVTSLATGSLAFGGTVTAATASLIPQGTDGSVATFANTMTNVTAVDLTCGGVYPAGPGAGTSTTWSRAVTFRCGSIPSTQGMIWGSFGASGSPQFEVFIAASTGHLTVSADIIPGTHVSYTGTASICDGNWHTVLVCADSAGTSTIYLDDVAVATLTLHVSGGPGAMLTDTIGGAHYLPAGTWQTGFAGDIAHVAEWPVCITPTNDWGLYEALVPAYASDSAAGRWARLLRFASPYATYRASTSVTSRVTAATDVSGKSAATCMDQMAVTENGDHYISGWGVATFKARSDRYNTSPVVVFGEREDLGEVPYEAPARLFDFDDLRVSSQAQVTQQPGGVVYTATDARTPLPYGPSILKRDNYAASGAELRDCATYLLGRYMDPHLRVRQIRVHVAVGTALWAACLGLSQGSRVRVMRRPVGGNPITWDGFVEKLSWQFTATADAWLTLQLSPADTQTYWMLSGPSADGTTSLASGAGVGAQQITLPGLAGGTMLNGGFTPGQPLVIGSGLGTSEIVTVTGSPVNLLVAVSGGQVGFTVTVPVTALVHTHSSGETVAVAGAVPGGAGTLAAYSVLDSTTRLAY